MAHVCGTKEQAEWVVSEALRFPLVGCAQALSDFNDFPVGFRPDEVGGYPAAEPKCDPSGVG